MNPPLESESPTAKTLNPNISILIESVKSLGFRKVVQKDEKVVFGIDISKTEEEKQYFVYDIEFFCKQNFKFQCLRSYFSVRGQPFIIKNTYLKYMLNLINLINSKLMIGAFFYEDSSNLVYYEINQIMPQSSSLNRSTQRLLDELVSSMIFSKTFYYFINYLKSKKPIFKALFKKRDPLPAGFTTKVNKSMQSFVSHHLKFYLERRAKDINMNRAHLHDPLNAREENAIIETLKTDERLNSFFILDKYSVKDSKVIVPIYRIGKGSKGIFYSSKSFVLAEKIFTSPRLLAVFQELLLNLMNKGFKMNPEIQVKKFKDIVSPKDKGKIDKEDARDNARDVTDKEDERYNVTKVINDDLFYNFIVTSDDKINFAYDEQRQLSNCLVEIENTREEKNRAKQEIIERVFETSVKLIENLCFDFSILDKDIESYIEKVHN